MLKSDRFTSELLNDNELSGETMGKTADEIIISKTAGDSKKNLKNESFNKKNSKNVSFNAHTKPGTSYLSHPFEQLRQYKKRPLNNVSFF